MSEHISITRSEEPDPHSSGRGSDDLPLNDAREQPSGNPRAPKKMSRWNYVVCGIIFMLSVIAIMRPETNFWIRMLAYVAAPSAVAAIAIMAYWDFKGRNAQVSLDSEEESSEEPETAAAQPEPKAKKKASSEGVRKAATLTALALLMLGIYYLLYGYPGTTPAPEAQAEEIEKQESARRANNAAWAAEVQFDGGAYSVCSARAKYLSSDGTDPVSAKISAKQYAEEILSAIGDDLLDRRMQQSCDDSFGHLKLYDTVDMMNEALRVIDAAGLKAQDLNLDGKDADTPTVRSRILQEYARRRNATCIGSTQRELLEEEARIHWGIFPKDLDAAKGISLQYAEPVCYATGYLPLMPEQVSSSDEAMPEAAFEGEPCIAENKGDCPES